MVLEERILEVKLCSEDWKIFQSYNVGLKRKVKPVNLNEVKRVKILFLKKEKALHKILKKIEKENFQPGDVLDLVLLAKDLKHNYDERDLCLVSLASEEKNCSCLNKTQEQYDLLNFVPGKKLFKGLGLVLTSK